MRQAPIAVLAVSVILALAACGGNDKDDAPTTSGSSEQGQEAETTEATHAQERERDAERRGLIAEDYCAGAPDPRVVARSAGTESLKLKVIAQAFANRNSTAEINRRAIYQGCLDGLRDPQGKAVKPQRPAPAHGPAELRTCDIEDAKLFPKGGGYDIQMRGLTCEEVGQILPYFGAAIGRDDLPEGVFDRGAWTCWVRLEKRFGPVTNVCWDQAGRVLIFKAA